MRWFCDNANPPADVRDPQPLLDAVRLLDRRAERPRPAAAAGAATDLSAEAFRLFRVQGDGGRHEPVHPVARRLHRRTRLRDLDDARLSRDALRRTAATPGATSASRISAAAR